MKETAPAAKTIGYPGSKFAPGVYHGIINQIPPHQEYVELCGGSGTILKIKKPAQVKNTIVEINQSVIDMAGYPAGAEVVNGCAIGYMKTTAHDRKVFIYADPPYTIEHRRNGRLYYGPNEWNENQHADLAQQLTATPAMVAISCYRSELYDELYKGWRFIEIPTMTRRGPATECVYFNYQVPHELHEYTFLGKDKTERQRIKRKIERWANRLNQLPVLERQAIISTLQVK